MTQKQEKATADECRKAIIEAVNEGDCGFAVVASVEDDGIAVRVIRFTEDGLTDEEKTFAWMVVGETVSDEAPPAPSQLLDHLLGSGGEQPEGVTGDTPEDLMFA